MGQGVFPTRLPPSSRCQREDPLGGCLSTEQMRQRDRQVFESFKGKPLVWNLAGGYQKDASGGIEPVLALHRNTVQEWINATPAESAA